MTKFQAYQILNLPYGADKERIEQAFASLILIYKPDKDPEKFMQIHGAYKTLTTGETAADIQLGNFEGDNFPADEWDDSFHQLDQEYDIQKEKEAKEQAEQEEKQKRKEEKKKARQARKEKRNAIPEKFNWDYVLSLIFILFAAQLYIFELSIPETFFLCALVFYYQGVVYLVRKKFKTGRYITKHLVSLPCVIFCPVLAEFFLSTDSAFFDCIMIQWSGWMCLWMITGVLALANRILNAVKV